MVAHPLTSRRPRLKRTWTQVAGIHDFVLKESGPGFDEVGVASDRMLLNAASCQVLTTLSSVTSVDLVYFRRCFRR
jgi:hypothetical protein